MDLGWGRQGVDPQVCLVLEKFQVMEIISHHLQNHLVSVSMQSTWYLFLLCISRHITGIWIHCQSFSLWSLIYTSWKNLPIILGNCNNEFFFQAYYIKFAMCKKFEPFISLNVFHIKFIIFSAVISKVLTKIWVENCLFYIRRWTIYL